MHRRTARLLAVLAALAIAAGLPVVLAPAAQAHGTVINPMHRAYSCWKRWGARFQDTRMATEDPMCWQAWKADPNAMWNWNGLLRDGAGGKFQTAAPDGHLCSGGLTSNGRYAALDKPGAWTATKIPNASSFTAVLHDQALHGADFLRFYVTKNSYDPVTQPLKWSDLVLLKDTGRIPRGQGTRSSDATLNGVSVSTTLSAPGMTGRHILFTIWQASHSDQSYYLCSDVIFGEGSQAAPAPATTSAAPQESPMPNIAGQVERTPTPATATSAPAATRRPTTAAATPTRSATQSPASTKKAASPSAAAAPPASESAAAAEEPAAEYTTSTDGVAVATTTAPLPPDALAAGPTSATTGESSSVDPRILLGSGLLIGLLAGGLTLPILLRARRRLPAH